MLLLIGLGLEAKDLSVRSLEAIRGAKKVYLEQYTTFISGAYIEYLTSESGKDITIVGRSELEEGAMETLKGAKNEEIAVLVPGDPLIATTHHATLLDNARKLGIGYKVYHASSIFSAAIGESGLDVYKFGPTVTVPYWSEKYEPASFLDAINRNLRNSMHTLVLLDLNQKEKRPMSLDEAVNMLKVAEKEKEYDIVNDDLRVLVMGDIGKETQEIAYVSLKELGKITQRFAKKTLCLIIPSALTFAEKESISKYAQ